MKKTRLKILSYCLFGSILLVLALYVIASFTNLQPKGFLRKLRSHQIKGLKFIKRSNTYAYFAGNTDSLIYFGDKAKRSNFFNLNFITNDTGSVRINGFDTMKFTLGGYLRTDVSSLYLFDGNKPAIMVGDAKTGRILQKLRSPYFTNALHISANSFLLKTSAKKKNNLLIKFSNGKLGRSYLLEEQGDGIFSTDGILLKVPNSSKIFYVYFYRNQFLCLDTNTTLLYKGKTIDTVSHANIKVVTIKSLHQITMASPPVYVNEQCAANENYLFIHSALQADNETNEVTNSSSAIDVYRVADGKYVSSFYISDFAGEKMRDFRVSGKILIAMFDNYIYKYQLEF